MHLGIQSSLPFYAPTKEERSISSRGKIIHKKKYIIFYLTCLFQVIHLCLKGLNSFTHFLYCVGHVIKLFIRYSARTGPGFSSESNVALEK